MNTWFSSKDFTAFIMLIYKYKNVSFFIVLPYSSSKRLYQWSWHLEERFFWLTYCFLANKNFVFVYLITGTCKKFLKVWIQCVYVYDEKLFLFVFFLFDLEAKSSNFCNFDNFFLWYKTQLDIFIVNLKYFLSFLMEKE